MIAYKLLRKDRVAPFSGIVWPQPGNWTEAARIDPCLEGIHACRADDLPFWLGLGELWEVELDGLVLGERKLVARRGRLVRRIEAWDERAADEFVAACAARAQIAGDPGYAADVAGSTPAVAGFIAARAAEVAGGPDAYDEERRAQAAWLTDALELRRSP